MSDDSAYSDPMPGTSTSGTGMDLAHELADLALEKTSGGGSDAGKEKQQQKKKEQTKPANVPKDGNF